MVRFVVLATVLVLATCIPMAALAKETPGARVTLLKEDFEGPAMNGRIYAYDNYGPGGEDYWGISDYRAHNGTHSAWAAQVGNNSVDGRPNAQNHYYDNDMGASMDIRVAQWRGFHAHISFWYWSATQPIQVDLLYVLVLRNNVWQTLWNQPMSTSKQWLRVDLPLPSDAEWVSLYFYSDASNYTYEGAYVDDLAIWGTTPSDATQPQTSLAVQEVSSTGLIELSFRSVDNETEILNVTIYYRHDGGPWKSLTTLEGFGSRIAVGSVTVDLRTLAGTGKYEFYAAAVDAADNVEVRDTAQVSMVFRGPAFNVFGVQTDLAGLSLLFLVVAMAVGIVAGVVVRSRRRAGPPMGGGPNG